MGKIVPQVYNVALDNVLGIFDYVVSPGTAIQSIYIASMPAAAVLSLAIEGKNPFRIYPGWAFDAGACNFIDNGIALVNPTGLPGQICTIVIIPAANAQGGAGFTNAS